MNVIKKVINRMKYKHPWHSYYKKNERYIETPNVSVFEHLYVNNKENKDAIAVNYFNKKMTFKQLFDQINVCAKALKSIGIREGDVVTVCLPNTPEAVISFYAINKIGAISNMLHPLSAEEEIKNSLISTNSVMLISINLSYAKIKNIIEDTKVYKTVIVSAADSMPKLLGFGYNLTQGRKIEVPKKSEFNLFWHDFMNRGRNYVGKVLVKTTKEQPCCM